MLPMIVWTNVYTRRQSVHLGDEWVGRIQGVQTRVISKPSTETVPKVVIRHPNSDRLSPAPAFGRSGGRQPAEKTTAGTTGDETVEGDKPGARKTRICSNRAYNEKGEEMKFCSLESAVENLISRKEYGRTLIPLIPARMTSLTVCGWRCEEV